MKKLETNLLDKIIKQTVSTVKESKTQIFGIYEVACQQVKAVQKEAETVKLEMANTIIVVDELERRLRLARFRLTDISRNFKSYSEADVKEAYEGANKLQIELAVARATELSLRRRRDEAELSLRNLQKTVDKAENLASKVGTILDYLASQMDNVLMHIETLQQKQEIGSKIIKAQEEERCRVAREIHDGPAQMMASIVFQVEVCERLAMTDTSKAKSSLKELQEQVRFCLKEIRKIIFDLRPMILDDLGLVPAINKMLELCKERNGLETELMLIGKEKRLNSYLEIAIFRSVQEAINNIIKHAKASKGVVRLEFAPAFISVAIEDDGIGFDPSQQADKESFGLLGMQERLDILNGEVCIKSQPSKGTTVFVKVPLKVNEAS